MYSDERLEEISDDIRHGIPVDIQDALAAIGYQSEKQAARKKLPWWKKIFS